MSDARERFLKEQIMTELENLKESIEAGDWLGAEMDSRDLFTYCVCMNERVREKIRFDWKEVKK